MQTVVIVGASLAGISSARALRSQGYAGALVVVGDESERPYDRPPLSKDFLSGKMSAAELWLEADQEDLGIQWRLGAAATDLDVHERIVTLGDGSRLPFDGAVLATGSRARTLPETAGIPNVHTLRTLEDARRLREQLRADGRLVVVGAGFVGAEVASTARSLGMDVTVIGADEVPLAGPLGAPMGALVGGLHRAHGVRLLCGTRVESLVVDDDGTDGGAAATAVRLADGREVPADVVVVGIGGLANTSWLRGSGLDLADGVRCDAAGRTGVPGIVAVGDCAAWFDDRLAAHVRLEHWTGALERPAVAVAALLEDMTDQDGSQAVAQAAFDPRSGRLAVPYFWSDQYGVRLQFAGTAGLADRVEIEAGDPAAFSFLAVYYRGEEAVAVLGLDQPRLFTRWRKALEKAVPSAARSRAAVPTLAVS